MPKGLKGFQKGNTGFWTIEKAKRVSQKLLGVKKSVKHRQNIAKAKIGNQVWLGRHHKYEAKRKVSEAHKGEKNYNWRGGITPLREQIRQCFEYRQWRSDIFTKDDFTCQKCGIRGIYLEAHHYPKTFTDIFDKYKIKTLEQALNCEEFWNLNNGITLCKKCHGTEYVKIIKGWGE